MWSKNSVPLALVVDGSLELAYYLKRMNGIVVYTHSGKNFAINLQDVNVKTNRDH